MARVKTRVEKDKRGLFISFEGGEGSGKTTQIGHLVRWLESHGHSALVTRQPGGTRIGSRIREILLDPKHKELCPRAELLLYEADRAQHVDETLRPALQAGKVLVSDRFADSSTVYQGICRELGMNEVIRLNDFATSGLSPDLVILLDLAEDAARERVRTRTHLDRMERENRAFHRAVRSGFLTLAQRFPDRFEVIDGSASEEAVAEQVRCLVRNRLKRRGLWKSPAKKR